MQEAEQKRDYTTAELGELAGVNASTIRRHLLAGKLAGRKVGRDWVIAAYEARRWLAEYQREHY